MNRKNFVFTRRSAVTTPALTFAGGGDGKWSTAAEAVGPAVTRMPPIHRGGRSVTIVTLLIRFRSLKGKNISRPISTLCHFEFWHLLLMWVSKVSVTDFIKSNGSVIEPTTISYTV